MTSGTPEHAPRDAEATLAADIAARSLGIELLEVAAGCARARMRVSEQMINAHGSCHGGYVFLLADTAFAYACNSHGPVTVASGADIVFVAPAYLGDLLSADARERVGYGRNGLYDVTVTREDGDVVAEFRGRSRALAGHPPEPRADRRQPGSAGDEPAGPGSVPP